MKPPDNRSAGDRRHWHLLLAILALVALVALVVAACAPLGTPLPGSPGAGGASVTPVPTPVPTPLVPADPNKDPPVSLLAFVFTPVFQALFILLVLFYKLSGNIAIAIVLLTLVIRALIIPLFRQQTVSQRRMQQIQPEIKEIQRRYRGDRTKISEAQMALYKERGVNPAAGCLPLVLQFILLIPMYSVIRDGLTNYDPSSMVTVLGYRLPILDCHNFVNGVIDKAKPCIDTIVLGVDMSKPEILFSLPGIGFGISLLAVIAGVLQLVQSRMVMPPQTAG
ncbi:MAG TPA: YidC/Oxa1 family membrane protein insertase, partial [Candidatus Limnocylindrales bacterium]